jgi:hypothetical protein
MKRFLSQTGSSFRGLRELAEPVPSRFRGLAAAWCGWLIACGLLGFDASVSAAERVYTVRQILEVEKSWPLFAETRTEFTVVGLIGSRTDRQIHMKNCKLRFELKPSVEFPNLYNRSKHLQLKGYFTKINGQPAFLVESLEIVPPLVQRFRTEAVSITMANFQAQRKLAERIRKESEFYDDAELLAQSKELFYQSLRTERSRAKDVSPEMFDGWIEQLKDFGIDETIRDEWRHDSLWLRWRNLKNPRGTEYRQFARLLGDTFPAARKPLETPQPKLREQYLLRPEYQFAEADSAQRDKLLRLFYIEVLVRDLEQEARPDGSNGDEIAARYRNSLPELPEKFVEHENAWLTWRSANVAQASRNDAIQLAQEYRTRNRPDEARVILEKWLQARLTVWKRDGASGFMRAAEEYLDLLEDRSQAAELLKSAWNLAPGHEEIEKKMADLGHHRHEGKWISTQEFEQLPPDKLQLAIQQGKVVPGMTPEQVRRAFGAPARRHTSFSAGRIGHVWVFGESGGKQTTVHFQRESRAAFEQARVIAVGETSPRTKK